MGSLILDRGWERIQALPKALPPVHLHHLQPGVFDDVGGEFEIPRGQGALKALVDQSLFARFMLVLGSTSAKQCSNIAPHHDERPSALSRG